MDSEKKIKVIISGGGTGGHIFPAISIANKIKEKYPSAEILFVGAQNRMEMTKVPEAGYKIIGLPIKPLPRKISFSIFSTFFNLIKSLKQAKKIIKDFKPNVVVGVGGYASFAVLHSAQNQSIPTLIQEQNSYAGLSNKQVTNKVKAICVAYPNMEKYFPAEKIHYTGNPVRNLNTSATQKEALEFFGLSDHKKTIFVTGGSLGARTINQSILKNISKLLESDIQIIWQTGQYYFENIKAELEKQNISNSNLSLHPFINQMDLAFKASDLVVARAGALTISELALLKKPAILVPSPNVAEDHQTKNALSLTSINAAIMIKDFEAEQKLIDCAVQTINNQNFLNQLSENIAKYAKPNAAEDIVLILSNLL